MRSAVIGLLAGLVAGALLHAGLRRVRGQEDAAAPVPAAASQAIGTAPDLQPLRAALRAATARLETLQKQAAAATSARAAGTPDPPSPAAVRAAIARWVKGMVKPDGDWEWDDGDFAQQEACHQLFELMRRIAADLGVGIEEVSCSPEGYGALVRAVVMGMDPPPDEKTVAAMDEALARLRKDWEAYTAVRKSMSDLERGREIDRMSGDMEERFDELFEGPLDSAYSVADTMWWTTQPSWLGSGSSTTYVDSAADYSRQLKEGWTERLGLDPGQSLEAGALADALVRDIATLNDALRREGKDPDRAGHAARLELMIQTQKKMAQSLNLTPEQAEALRKLDGVPNFEVR